MAVVIVLLVSGISGGSARAFVIIVLCDLAFSLLLFFPLWPSLLLRHSAVFIIPPLLFLVLALTRCEYR